MTVLRCHIVQKALRLSTGRSDARELQSVLLCCHHLFENGFCGTCTPGCILDGQYPIPDERDQGFYDTLCTPFYPSFSTSILFEQFHLLSFIIFCQQHTLHLRSVCFKEWLNHIILRHRCDCLINSTAYAFFILCLIILTYLSHQPEYSASGLQAFISSWFFP